MEYNSVAAIVSGLIAGAIMLVPIYLGRMMMPDKMRMDLLKMLGTMLMPVSGMTYGVGLMIHAVMSMIFASTHAAFYLWLDLDDDLVVWGLLFGAVHWIGASIFFGMIGPSIHRGVRDGTVEPPGFFGLNLGGMTVTGVLVVHILFGLFVGLFYEALA
ncbi:MAG: hypothetical protein O3B95_12765 [Chloroflexi bacterium]|nr:hypothetical protein [Chloroflexota bacterium]